MPGERSPRSAYPVGAAGFGILGATLILVEGVYFLLTGPAQGGNNPLVTGSLIPTSSGDAVLSILEGGIALGLIGVLAEVPSMHATVGIGAITISVLSLFSGGGYLLGALLLWVAGALAVYFQWDREPSYRHSSLGPMDGKSPPSEISELSPSDQ